MSDEWTPVTKHFKSTDAMWWKEYTGKKPNTVRLMDTPPWVVIESLEAGAETRIEVTNALTGRKFTRQLVDVTAAGEMLGKYLVIFSWQHDPEDVAR